jgi:TPR repeat protein
MYLLGQHSRLAPADSEVTNSKHAAYWLMQAAKQKHPDAIFELGLLFETGARACVRACVHACECASVCVLLPVPFLLRAWWQATA